VPDGLFGLGARLDSREHDPGRAQVEGVPGTDALGGLDPHEHRDAVRIGGRLLVQQLALVAAAAGERGDSVA
jgi:hypothetical protein